MLILSTASTTSRNHTGNRPMKKDQPGVHPEKDGSKLARAKETGRRPDAALTDRHIKITLNGLTQVEATATCCSKRTDDA
jgi:hypothetical protein